MNLYEAVFVRKSVRKYKRKALEQSKLEEIMNFARSLPMLFPGITVEYKIINHVEEKHYFKHTFSVKAPHYLILSSSREDNYLMNGGYLMQQISLYMTAKGIGSCYMGAARPKKTGIEGLEHGYVISLAFGEGEHEIYRPSDKAKRLPAEKITVYKTEVNKNIKTLIQAARLSPSSMNSQPWGFVVYDNRIHIFCRKNLLPAGFMDDMKYIDIGVCLAHLLVAAEELWIDVKTIRMDNISNISFKKNEYVLTLKLS